MSSAPSTRKLQHGKEKQHDPGKCVDRSDDDRYGYPFCLDHCDDKLTGPYARYRHARQDKSDTAKHRECERKARLRNSARQSVEHQEQSQRAWNKTGCDAREDPFPMGMRPAEKRACDQPKADDDQQNAADELERRSLPRSGNRPRYQSIGHYGE